jgi:hypothetical protein
MKITQILETTTSGSVSTVAMPLGQVERRTPIRGLEPIANVMKAGSKKQGPYANSLTEGAMKQLSMDLKELTDAEFLKKYKKTKAEARVALRAKPEQVDEAKLDEEDLILVPGQGHKLKPGFISKANDRTDREIEMAISDLIQSAKNAETIYNILQGVSEDIGIEGWVQEKIIKASDYLNTVAEYLEGKKAQSEGSTAGTIAGGIAAESELGEVGIPFRGVGGAFNRGDDERHDLDVPKTQVWGLKINGKVWTKNSEAVIFKSKEAALKSKQSILSKRPELEIGVVTKGGTNEGLGGEIVGGVIGGALTKNVGGAMTGAKLGSAAQDMFTNEGAKVDRMVKHVAKSEKKLGHGKKEAENIAWATANKRGMLNNKNKKA